MEEALAIGADRRRIVDHLEEVDPVKRALAGGFAAAQVAAVLDHDITSARRYASPGSPVATMR